MFYIMDEIDCLQIEIIELEQRIILLKKLVQVKLKELENKKDLVCLNCSLKECDREKEVDVGKQNLRGEYAHYVNSLIFS